MTIAPRSLPNTSPEMQWLHSLRSELTTALQREIGIIASGTNPQAIKAVANHPPATRQDTISRANHTAGAMSVVYVFAIEESLGDDRGLSPAQRHDVWESGLSQPDHDLLLAFRHIRNTAAHGYQGKRARTGYTEFDSLVGQLGHMVKSSDADTITLHSSAGVHASQQLGQLAGQAIATLVSPV